MPFLRCRGSDIDLFFACQLMVDCTQSGQTDRTYPLPLSCSGAVEGKRDSLLPSPLSLLPPRFCMVSSARTGEHIYCRYFAQGRWKESVPPSFPPLFPPPPSEILHALLGSGKETEPRFVVTRSLISSVSPPRRGREENVHTLVSDVRCLVMYLPPGADVEQKTHLLVRRSLFKKKNFLLLPSLSHPPGC